MSSETSSLERLRRRGSAFTSPEYWRQLSFVSVLGHVVAIGLSLMIVLPVLYVFLVTFRPQSSIFSTDIFWIPRQFTFTHYVTAWNNIKGNLLNSLIIATGTAVLSLLITIPGAYAVSRLEFPGQRVAFFGIVITLMFPTVLLVGPIGSVWREVGLFNTYPGLWIAYQAFVSPFSLWILRDFFEGLPDNLEEAARVYGCTSASAIYRVIVPLSLPAIAAVTFLAFLTGWNDFLFSNLLTQSSHQPAVVTIYIIASGHGSIPWSLILAESFIVGAPPVLLYFISQRYMSETFAI